MLIQLLALCAVAAAASDVTSFTSNDGVYCADGPSRVAESALAIKKASPIGGLFNTSFGVAGKTCASRGYGISSGMDSCTPGVKTAYKAPGDDATFNSTEAAALASFAARYKLPSETAQLMVTCTCHPSSTALADAAATCSLLNTTNGSWGHRHRLGPLAARNT